VYLAGPVVYVRNEAAVGGIGFAPTVLRTRVVCHCTLRPSTLPSSAVPIDDTLDGVDVLLFTGLHATRIAKFLWFNKLDRFASKIKHVDLRDTVRCAAQCCCHCVSSPPSSSSSCRRGRHRGGEIVVLPLVTLVVRRFCKARN
jgi:hypothetical protein